MPAVDDLNPLSPPASAETWAGELAHDLRQPLSTIQSATCFLKLILQGNERALACLDLIEGQVCESEQILKVAVATARRNFAQPVISEAGNFDLTNAATADVT
jgi:hypothetical protein